MEATAATPGRSYRRRLRRAPPAALGFQAGATRPETAEVLTRATTASACLLPRSPLPRPGVFHRWIGAARCRCRFARPPLPRASPWRSEGGVHWSGKVALGPINSRAWFPRRSTVRLGVRRRGGKPAEAATSRLRQIRIRRRAPDHVRCQNRSSWPASSDQRRATKPTAKAKAVLQSGLLLPPMLRMLIPLVAVALVVAAVGIVASSTRQSSARGTSSPMHSGERRRGWCCRERRLRRHGRGRFARAGPPKSRQHERQRWEQRQGTTAREGSEAAAAAATSANQLLRQTETKQHSMSAATGIQRRKGCGACRTCRAGCAAIAASVNCGQHRLRQTTVAPEAQNL